MANHEYILKCKTFEVDAITKELEDICRTVLKDLYVVRRENTDDDNAYWTVNFKEDEKLLEAGPFELWLDHTDVSLQNFNELEGVKIDSTLDGNAEYDDSDDEFDEAYERIRCIEARHKPGDFMWWLDIQIMSHLCSRLGGKMIDEGASRIFVPDPNKYPTVTAWIERMWSGFGPVKKTLMKSLAERPPHKSLKVFYG